MNVSNLLFLLSFVAGLAWDKEIIASMLVILAIFGIVAIYKRD